MNILIAVLLCEMTDERFVYIKKSQWNESHNRPYKFTDVENYCIMLLCEKIDNILTALWSCGVIIGSTIGLDLFVQIQLSTRIAKPSLSCKTEQFSFIWSLYRFLVRRDIKHYQIMGRCDMTNSSLCVCLQNLIV